MKYEWIEFKKLVRILEGTVDAELVDMVVALAEGMVVALAEGMTPELAEGMAPAFAAFRILLLALVYSMLLKY